MSKQADQAFVRPPDLEVDPQWEGKVLDREVVTPSGSSVGHFYQSFAKAGGAEPLTGWGADVIHCDWSPSSSDVVFTAGTEITSGSPPSVTQYAMGAWSGNLVKSLGSDQAMFEIYEASWTGSAWVKTGNRLGVLVVRSDGLEYHKAASVSSAPTSISGDRTLPLYLLAHTSLDLSPGSGNKWWSAVDPEI